jgi:hypothetical protein
MGSFFTRFLDKKARKEASNQQEEKVVQDQDTVVSDMICEAAMFLYDVANHLSVCISKCEQSQIDVAKLNEARLAMAFLKGLQCGLAIDNIICKWYMTEMDKCMVSINESQATAFHAAIYIPPPPWDILNFNKDEVRCKSFMIYQYLQVKTPCKADVDRVKKELVENEECSWLFKNGILKIDDFPGAYNLGGRIEGEKKMLSSVLLDELEKSEDEANVEDASANALGLRNLYRQGKIGKEQYIASLATLVAAGVITKSDFTGLKAAVNG